MSEMRRDPVSWIVRQAAPLAVLVALVGFAVRTGAQGLTNDDTFFHLRIGHEFLSGRWSLWSPGSMSSHAARDWLPTQWLSEVIMAKAEDLAGTSGVAWLAGTLFIAYALTLYAVSRRFAPPIVAVLASLLTFLASDAGLSARPQVLSYLFAAVVTAAWLATARDGRVRWWIIPLTWLWAMLHGMWPVAIAISVVGAAGVLLDRRPGRGEALRLLAVPAGSLAAACLTPLGPRLVLEVVTVTSRGKYFLEWGPTDFHGLYPAALLVVLGTTVIVLIRGGSTLWTHALLVLLAGGWAVYAMRTVPVAAAIAAPCAALALAGLVPARPPIDRRGCLALLTTGIVATAILAALVGGKTVGPPRPGWADAELDRLAPGTSVLDAWEWGGYLAWRHPDLNFVISGYGDMFTTAELDRNVALTDTDEGWLEDLASTDARIALVAPDSDLAYGLEQTAGWTVVRSSDDMVLLEAPD
jgi:hypothetical protein